MRIGLVTGSIWATRKHPALGGQALLQVSVAGDSIIAVDYCGAGVGEVVLITLGSSASAEKMLPVDAAVIAILDQSEGSNCQQTKSLF